jgi:hypothetical protein
MDISPTLRVEVSEPDGDTMNVSFYNASNDILIGTDHDVSNGNTASMKWVDLSYNIKYMWYAKANDSELETESDIWSFTIIEEDNIPPCVKIIKPERALYIFDKKVRKYIFSRIPLIVGTITIEAHAADEATGIERVDFYWNDNLLGSDTEYPYSYTWEKDRIRLIHLFRIKVIAYDNVGLTDGDQMIVRKIL